MAQEFDQTLISRIAEALERLAPRKPVAPDLEGFSAFVWHASPPELEPVPRVNRVDLSLLRGIDLTRDILIESAGSCARARPAPTVLLWGARGMGKSSLVKAAHHEINQATGDRLKLIEIHREDIESLPLLMNIIRKAQGFRFIVFCDDLSFDSDDPSYKSLKAALDGGIEGIFNLVVARNDPGIGVFHGVEQGRAAFRLAVLPAHLPFVEILVVA